MAAQETVEQDTLVSMLKSLDENMKSLNVTIRERLDNLEAPPSSFGCCERAHGSEQWFRSECKRRG